MISKECAARVMFEKGREAREQMVDKLKEQDTRYLLKMILWVTNGEMPV